MAYNDPFDVTTPTGAAPISQGDDRIRELKRALNERLDTVFGNWPDGEPLELKLDFLESTGLRVVRGLLKDRPAADSESPVQLYYATDTGLLYVRGEDSWDTLGIPASYGQYVTANPSGTKVQFAAPIASMLTTHLEVTTDANGYFTIDLAEFGPEYKSSNVVAPIITAHFPDAGWAKLQDAPTLTTLRFRAYVASTVSVWASGMFVATILIPFKQSV